MSVNRFIRLQRGEWYPFFALKPTPGTSGIYGIINNRNSKLYIGSAKCLRKRFREHRIWLQTGRHHNRYLQRAFNKEPEVFEYFVIEEVKDFSLILNREQFWMDFYEANKPLSGYNISPKAGNCAGIKRTEEQKAHLSKIFKGIKLSPERRAKISAGQLGIKHKPMSDIALENCKKAAMKRRGCKQSPEVTAKRLATIKLNGVGNKPVIQLDLLGNVVTEFPSILAAEAKFGKRSNIHSVCKGKRTLCFGFKWRYKNAIIS